MNGTATRLQRKMGNSFGISIVDGERRESIMELHSVDLDKCNSTVESIDA